MMDKAVIHSAERMPHRLYTLQKFTYFSLSLVSADGEDIEHRDTISVLQNRVAQALRREIRSSLRVDPDDTFMQLFIVLPMLREMNVAHRNLVSNFKMKMPGMFSDLHQEVFE